ncbi:unnamed protein product [Rhodiola kirilowii]
MLLLLRCLQLQGMAWDSTYTTLRCVNKSGIFFLQRRKSSTLIVRRQWDENRCCDKVGLKRGPWTIEEDHKLMNFIITNGIHCWRTVPKLAGLLRWGFTEAEEDQIISAHQTLGNRWSKIASHFIGRTDNEIQNHWNTRIKKRLKGIGSRSDDLLSNYEIFNGNLEVIEHWLNEESIEELDGQSSSASFQESLNASMSDFSPGLLENQNGDSGVQEGRSELQWWYGAPPVLVDGPGSSPYLEEEILLSRA